MRPRFTADYRALFWALVLFPLVPIIQYQSPRTALWLPPVSLYLCYCAGILSHNHNHRPVFKSRAMNLVYSIWLSIFYGLPIFGWIPTHNRNHHLYSNGERDRTRTTRRYQSDNWLVLLSYPLWSSYWQVPALLDYAKEAWQKQPLRFLRIVSEAAFLLLAHAAALLLAIRLHGPSLGALVYFAALGIPALIAPYLMMITNYLQHSGCDALSADNHSRNFVSPFFNWFVFDNGYHTVHHEQPGMHWSRYRALHRARAERIDPRLNCKSVVGYCLLTYVIAPIRKAFARPHALPVTGRISRRT